MWYVSTSQGKMFDLSPFFTSSLPTFPSPPTTLLFIVKTNTKINLTVRFQNCMGYMGLLPPCFSFHTFNPLKISPEFFNLCIYLFRHFSSSTHPSTAFLLAYHVYPLPNFSQTFLFFWQLTGFTLLVVGIAVLVGLRDYLDLSETDFTNMPYILIGTGLFMIAAGIIGCCAVVKNLAWFLQLVSHMGNAFGTDIYIEVWHIYFPRLWSCCTIIVLWIN